MKRNSRLLCILLACLLVCSSIPASYASSAAPSSLNLADKSKTLQILVIGNSYSVDSTEYLYDVATEAGYKVVIGNLNKGSQTLANHYSYASNNSSVYTYRETNSGSWSSKENATMKYALQKRSWDIIFFQQYSTKAGISSSFYNSSGKNYLELLVNYAKNYCTNSSVKFGYEMTWAYRNDTSSTNSDFKKYFNCSQTTMYNSICETTQECVENLDCIDVIAKVGTAVQNARSSYMGDTLNRDIKHLSYDLGRYLAAMSMAYSVGIDISSLSTLDTAEETFSAKNLDVMKQSVYDSVSNPYSITSQTTVVPTLSNPTLTITTTSKTRKLSWTKINGATGYVIKQKKYGASSWTSVKSVGANTTSWAHSNVSNNVGYYYLVYAIGDDYIANEKSNSVFTCYTTMSSASNTSSGIKIQWGKCSNASGYKIYRKANSDTSWTAIKTITGSSTTSWTDTNVSNGDKYKYTVRAYIKSDGNTIWGQYNSSGITKYRLTTTSIYSYKNSQSKKLTVKWNKNSEASGYQLQYSTSSSFSSYKTITISKGSTCSKTISGLTKGKRYYIRVRSYKTVSGTKYYSGWSSVKNIKITK